MCNLSALVIEKGIQEGIQQGIQQEKENSLFRAAELSRDYGIPMEIALAKLKSDKVWEDSAVDNVVHAVYKALPETV